MAMRNQNKVFQKYIICCVFKVNQFIIDVTQMFYCFHRPSIDDGLDSLLFTSSLRVQYFW